MTLGIGMHTGGKVVLAADRMTTVDGSPPIRGSKIFEEFGMHWVMAGDVSNERVLRSLDLSDCVSRDDQADDFREWFLANVAEHHKKFRGDFEMLAARPGELWYVGSDLLPFEIDTWRCIGSGGPYASGIVAYLEDFDSAGASEMWEVFKTVAKLDLYTGSDYDLATL